MTTVVGVVALLAASLALAVTSNTAPGAAPRLQHPSTSSIPMADGDSTDIPDVAGALDEVIAKTYGSRAAWMKDAQQDVERNTAPATAPRQGRTVAHGFLTSGVANPHITEAGDAVVITNFWEGGGSLVDGERTFSFPEIAGGYLASDPTVGYLLLTYERAQDGSVGVPIEFLIPLAGEVRIEDVQALGEEKPYVWQGGNAQVLAMTSKVAYTVDLMTTRLSEVLEGK